VRLFFYAHDAGGANAIAPLISLFDNPLVFGGGPAMKILPGTQPLSVGALSYHRPDFLVTGTSDESAERCLWQEAVGLSIPSMAILDSWVNYGSRFSSYKARGLSLFDGICDCVPDYVCVMDEFAKSEMANDGVPPDRIVVLGNPYFEVVSQAAISQTVFQKSEKRIVLFASQQFSDARIIGAEEIALKDLINIASAYKDVIVRIRAHPRESDDKYKEYISECVELDDNIDLFTSIAKSETVVSVSSMALLEAAVFGKKIISYQPKSVDGKNDFILTRNGALPFLQDYEEFHAFFNEVMDGRAGSVECNICNIGASDRIYHFIKERLDG
jgi:hypothetical protein